MPPRTRSAVATRSTNAGVTQRPAHDSNQDSTVSSQNVSDQSDDSDVGALEEDANSDSADEWRPDEPQSKAGKRRTRAAAPESEEGSDDDQDVGDDAVSEGEDEMVAQIRRANKRQSTSKEKKRKKTAESSTGQASRKKLKPSGKSAQTRKESIAVEDDGGGTDDDESDSLGEGMNGGDPGVDSEEERMQALADAEAAWASVRSRKAAGTSASSANAATDSSAKTPAQSATATAPNGSAPRSLTSWLGVGPSASSSADELSSLPWPTTCEAAQIVDRSSLFVGYVYPLLTTSASYIAALLSHLARLVHPTVPVELLPPQFANAPANKRGSSHDMYAYRVLTLRRGRSGLTGPDDFGLQEEKEDDGERWGGDRVLKVAKEEGASDVLVIVSRWYGGEMLGPVRFEHIENAARKAIEKHVEAQMVEHRRMEIVALDGKVEAVRAKVQIAEGGGEPATATTMTGMTPSKQEAGDRYPDLSVAKADRLLLARKRTIQALERKLVDLQRPRETEPEPEPTLEPTAIAPRGASLSPPPPLSPSDEPERESELPPPTVQQDPARAEVPRDEDMAATEEAAPAPAAVSPEGGHVQPSSPPPTAVEIKPEPQPTNISSDQPTDVDVPTTSQDGPTTLNDPPTLAPATTEQPAVKSEPIETITIKPDPDGEEVDATVTGGTGLFFESDASLSDAERELSSSPEEVRKQRVKKEGEEEEEEDQGLEAYGEERGEGEEEGEGEDLAGWDQL